jgi:predicted MFS family arabinose efflux permease
MMLDLGLIAGAPVVGQIADSFGFDLMFIVIGVNCFVAAVIYFWSSVPIWRARKLERAQKLRSLEEK